MIAAVLIAGFVAAGATVWTLSQLTLSDEERVARELNALAPAAGPTEPKPTTLIEESEPPEPAREGMEPAPVSGP